jgi:hypothetical protein
MIQRPIMNYVVANAIKNAKMWWRRKSKSKPIPLRIDIYDNGEVDGDSISIFFNDKLLASSQKLTAKAIHLSLGLDSTKPNQRPFDVCRQPGLHSAQHGADAGL